MWDGSCFRRLQLPTLLCVSVAARLVRVGSCFFSRLWGLTGVFFILSFLGSYIVTGGLNTGGVMQRRLNNVYYIGCVLALSSSFMLRYTGVNSKK